MAKKSNVLPEDPRLEEMREIAKNHPGKFVLLDEEGNLVIPPIYDFIGAPVNGICLIQKDGKYGYVRTDGSIIAEPSFEKAWSFDDGLAPIEVNGKWGFIDESGKVVIAPQYDERTYFSEGLAVIKKNNKYGYIDLAGNTVIEPAYEYAQAFKNGLGMIKLNGKYGFINARGEMVIAPELEAVKSSALYNGAWQKDFAVATLNGAQGIIDVTGRWVLPPKYSEVRLFLNMASSRQEVDGEVLAEFEVLPGGCGLISQNGRIVAQPVFKKIFKFSNGLAAAQEASGKCGYINLDGEWALAPQYDGISDFKGELALVRSKDRKYVINKEGKEVGDKFKILANNLNGKDYVIPDRYVIARNGKWGLFDGNLTEILPVEFDSMELWGPTELIEVEKDGKYGLIDKNGKEILPIKYKQFNAVREDKPLAEIGEDWGTNEGAINAEGKWIVPPVYTRCYVYSDVITVEKDNLKGLLDLEGNEIFPCSLEQIGSFYNSSMTTARKDGKYGVLSNKGEWIIKPEFEGIEVPAEGLAAARKDNKWGFVNLQGEWVIEPTWKGIEGDKFTNGVAVAVDESAKSVIIDRTGKALTKPASTVRLYDAKDGMRLIKVGRKFGYLTDDGKVAIKPTFDEAEDFSDGWAQVSLKVDKQPVWTFIDREGRYGPVYNEQISLFGSLTEVKQDEKIALLRPNGTMAIPYIFSRVDKKSEGFIPARIAGF